MFQGVYTRFKAFIHEKTREANVENREFSIFREKIECTTRAYENERVCDETGLVVGRRNSVEAFFLFHLNVAI